MRTTAEQGERYYSDHNTRPTTTWSRPSRGDDESTIDSIKVYGCSSPYDKLPAADWEIREGSQGSKITIIAITSLRLQAGSHPQREVQATALRPLPQG